MIKSLCVFCGSSDGNKTIFQEQAYQIGQLLAENNIKLVYGGASIGLMGKLAQGALEHKGEVTGVIPESLADKEIAHRQLSALHVVNSMHQRKEKMYQLSDGFLAIPGGFGTLDELFEILTWKQLGIHNKPIYLLNTDCYFDDLYKLVNTFHKNGFVSQEHASFLNFVNSISSLKEAILN